MKRRQVLAVVGTAGLASVAGCATIETELGMRTQTLGPVNLKNTESDAVTVDLEVIQNGETIHSSSHDLPPVSSGSDPVVVHEWSNNEEAHRWTVRARTGSSEWHDATLDAARGNNCHNVLIETGDWSESSVLVLPRQCESGRTY